MYILTSYERTLQRMRRVQPAAHARKLLQNRTERCVQTDVEFMTSEPQLYSTLPALRERTVTKFFFDYDEKMDVEPDQYYLNQVKETLKERVQLIMTTGTGMIIEDGASLDIVFASRHGRLPDGAFKVSYRIFVGGFRTTLTGIRNAIINTEVSSGFKMSLDMSIYASNRRLCMILCKKSARDDRILLPEADEPYSEDFIRKFFVQDVDDSWPLIEVERFVQVDEANNDANERVPARQEKRTRTCLSHDTFKRLIPVLESIGFVNPFQTGLPREMNDRDIYFDFSCENRHDCPICHKSHDNNMWYMSVIPGKDINVGNHSDRCGRVSIIDNRFFHPLVDTLMEVDMTNQLMCDTYIASRPGRILFNPITSMFHEFTGDKWSTINDNNICNEMNMYVRVAILEKQKSMIESMSDHFVDLGVHNEHIDRRLADLKSRVKKAIATTSSYTFLKHCVLLLQTVLCVTDDIFDKNPDVVHFSNGVYDLKTESFRETNAEDYNINTTGYDFDTHPDPEADAIHGSLINKVYPNPYHRETAQRVFGSTLSGSTCAKKFFVFTDNGGEYGGNNGKSMMFFAHAKALGDYCLHGKKEMLYDSSQSSAEGASPGLMKMANKRAIIYEELEHSKKLNEGFVKEMTSGLNPIVSARNLYKGVVMLELCCKMLVACNHGKFPRFDSYDTALTNRFLIVPHVSHFTANRNILDDTKHVYLIDFDLPDKLNNIKMTHMKWLIDGYRNARWMKFADDTLDRSLNDFKQQFIYKNTPIYIYLGEELVNTGDMEKDKLDMACVWDKYRRDRRSNKYITMEQFMLTFKVFVNTELRNSFQFRTELNNRIPIARGFKLRLDTSDKMTDQTLFF